MIANLSKWENTCNFRQEMVDAETKKALSGIPLLKTKVTIRKIQFTLNLKLFVGPEWFIPDNGSGLDPKSRI